MAASASIPSQCSASRFSGRNTAGGSQLCSHASVARGRLVGRDNKILDGMRFNSSTENTKSISSAAFRDAAADEWDTGRVLQSRAHPSGMNVGRPEEAGYDTSSVSSGLNTEHRRAAKPTASVKEGGYLQHHALHLLLVQLLSQLR